MYLIEFVGIMSLGFMCEFGVFVHWLWEVKNVKMSRNEFYGCKWIKKNKLYMVDQPKRTERINPLMYKLISVENMIYE